MQPDPDRSRLEDLARRRGYPDDAARLDRLLAYRDALLDVGRTVNLTAARTPQAVLEVVVLSALAVVRTTPRPPARVLDLGSGNGMPGVAAAVAWPEASVLLLERREKKARALEAILARSGIAAEVVCADAAALLARRPDVAGSIDLVTVRAVGPLDEAARLAAPWLAPGGRLAHWKGAGLSRGEVARGRRAAARAGLSALPPLAFEDDAGPHRLVIYERQAS